MKRLYNLVCASMFSLFFLGGGQAYAQISYSQNWDAGDLNSWTSIGGGGSFSRNTTYMCTGAGGLRANIYGSNASSLTSPALTGNNGGVVTVNFNYRWTNSTATTGSAINIIDYLKVLYSTSATGPFIEALVLPGTSHVVSTSCVNATATFNSIPPTGNIFVRFLAKTKNGGDTYCFIDDVNITQGAAPACNTPYAISGSNLNGNSITLSWSAVASQTNWNVQWGAPGFVPGTGTEIGSNSSTGTPSNNIGGLTPLTTYHAYVQSNCGTGLSEWAGPFVINTPQTPATLPFLDDFSSSNWIMQNGNQTNKWFVGAADGNPANSMYISNDNGATATYGHTTSVSHATKSFTLPASTLGFDLSFDWKAGGEGTTTDRLRVWIVSENGQVTQGSEISTTSPAGSVQLANINRQSTWQSAHLVIPASFAGTTVKVVFEWRNDGSVGTVTPSAVVDNVSIKSLTCLVPTALAVTSVTTNSVSTSWTAGATETSWNIVWGTPGFTIGGTGQLGTQTSTTPSAIISGLTGSTNYQIYIQANCGSGDLSHWTGPLSAYTGHCIPSYSNTGDYTSAFATTNAVSNVTYTASSQPANGYANNAAGAPIISTPGSTINFNHTYVGGGNTLKMWVDWNNNLVFDTNESVYEQYVSVADQSGSFVVPAGTPQGSYRLRLRSRFSTTVPGACSSETFGSALDYTLVVVSQTAPVATQSSGTPTCVDGTILTATGTPSATELWYWQTTATGTSTANDGTTPWNVFENGTYYIRALNTTYNIWSDASSVVVSNIPTIAAPAAPMAGANPACVPGTEIAMFPAPAGFEYYWQGTSNASSSVTENASSPYLVSSTGTYYVKALETATQCWSIPVGVAVTVETFVPTAPIANPAELLSCAGATSIVATANAASSSSLEVIIGTNLSNSGSLTVPFVMPAVPAGATITSAQLQLSTVTALGSSLLSEIRVAISGAYTLAQTTIANANPTINLTGYPAAGGNMNLLLTETYDDSGVDATFGMIKLVVNYSLPATTVNWYDAAQAGNFIATGSTLETIGSSVIPVAIGGVYEFYAESVVGACTSTDRTLITVSISDVHADLITIPVTCHDGNDGSFSLSTIHCGTAPFVYSVDGGAFGAIPTNLTVGSHDVVIKDAADLLSGSIPIVVGNATAPSAVVVTGITNSSAIVSWTAGGTETSWNIEWGPAGFTPGTGTAEGTATANAIPYTITNLTGATDYEVFVSANCGVGTTASAWSSDVFSTICDLVTVPYLESFEENSESIGCWTVGGVTGTSIWALYEGATNGPITTAYEGEVNAVFYNTGFSSGSQARLISPSVDVSNQDSVALIFAYTQPEWGSDQNTTTVTYRNATSGAWTTVETFADNIGSWTLDTLVIPTTADTLQIGFLGYDDYGYDITVDNVQLLPCSLTPGIDGATTLCRTAETVDLNTLITAGETYGKWVHSNLQSMITNSTFNFSMLSAGTYDLYYIVSTPCAADTTIATITVVDEVSAGTDGMITACKNQPIDLYGGLTGVVNFGGTWYAPNGTALPSSNFQTGALGGQYVYQYVVGNAACGTDTSEVLVNVQSCDFVGVEEVNSLEEIVLSPNPTTGNFQIAGVKTADFAFTVTDVNGRVIMDNVKITASTTDVNLSGVETGVYLVRIFNSDSDRMIRVIKQ